MAALHTLYRTSQRLRVLTCDRAGGRTAVIAPLTLIAVFPNVPFFTALGAQCGCPPGYHLAMLGAHVGIGSDGVTETGAVPNGLTGASVIDADVQVWLGVHQPVAALEDVTGKDSAR